MRSQYTCGVWARGTGLEKRRCKGKRIPCVLLFDVKRRVLIATQCLWHVTILTSCQVIFDGFKERQRKREIVRETERERERDTKTTALPLCSLTLFLYAHLIDKQEGFPDF